MHNEDKNVSKESFVGVKPPVSLLRKKIKETLPEMEKAYNDRLRRRIIAVAKGDN